MYDFLMSGLRKFQYHQVSGAMYIKINKLIKLKFFIGLGALCAKTLWYLLSLLNSLLLPPQPAGCVTATPLLLLLSKNMLRIF